MVSLVLVKIGLMWNDGRSDSIRRIDLLDIHSHTTETSEETQ